MTPPPPQLSSRYGPVLSLRLGSERAVVVSGMAALRELLVSRGDEFVTRGHFAIGEKESGNLGLFLSNGAAWVSVRRFTLTALRDGGMGSRGVEEMAMEEVAELIRELEKGGGEFGGGVSKWGVWDPQMGGVGPSNGGKDSKWGGCGALKWGERGRWWWRRQLS